MFRGATEDASNHLQTVRRHPDRKVKGEAVRLWTRAVPAAVARLQTVSLADYRAYERAQLDRWRAESGLRPATDEEFRVGQRQQSQQYHDMPCDRLGNLLPVTRTGCTCTECLRLRDKPRRAGRSPQPCWCYS